MNKYNEKVLTKKQIKSLEVLNKLCNNKIWINCYLKNNENKLNGCLELFGTIERIKSFLDNPPYYTIYRECQACLSLRLKKLMENKNE